jgi:hypothetical protein
MIQFDIKGLINPSFACLGLERDASRTAISQEMALLLEGRLGVKH